MALQVALTSKFGFALPEAYVRFEKTPRVNYGTGTVSLTLEVFADATAVAEGKPPVPGFALAGRPVTRSFNPATDTPLSVVAAAYAAVKADGVEFPELAEATNV